MVEFRVRLKREQEDQEGNYTVIYKKRKLTIPDSLFIFTANTFEQGMDTIRMEEVKEIVTTETKKH